MGCGDLVVSGEAATKDELMKLQVAYDEMRNELRSTLMQKMEMELETKPQLDSELEELSRR